MFYTQAGNGRLITKHKIVIRGVWPKGILRFTFECDCNLLRMLLRVKLGHHSITGGGGGGVHYSEYYTHKQEYG